MATRKKLKDTRIKVIQYLSNHPKALEFRDDDRKLVARFQCDELAEQGINVKKISAYEFFKIYVSGGKITSADIITRARRKAQEDCEELRGKSWKERHNEDDDVRDAVVNNEI